LIPTTHIALKVDVDTFRGTREGVPPLAALLRKHDAGATFLFSLGPDHTGRALRRIFRPGFLQKVWRTSVGANYGLKTLCYGVLLPGPHIGRRAGDQMRAVRDAGFEVGIHTHDHVLWQDNVINKSPEWTQHQMQLAAEEFREVFAVDAPTHGAAGWQMNDAAYEFEDRLAMSYCSDGRGTQPFVPVVRGHALRCVQLPTTLPTFDEVIGLDGCTEGNVAQRIAAISEQSVNGTHVFTLHAEVEGMRLLPAFDALLQLWKTRGVKLCSLADIYKGLSRDELPRHLIQLGEIPGRSGTLSLQGPVAS
jgi:undecaprenyl phosphate-alpha-L-ara4FN deformylase